MRVFFCFVRGRAVRTAWVIVGGIFGAFSAIILLFKNHNYTCNTPYPSDCIPQERTVFMNTPIRFGILGYARIARLHLIPAMLEAKNTIPYAIASGSPEKLKQAKDAFGFAKTYGDYESLLHDPDVDAVYIPLPNSLHKEWTIRAARAGKHVLCEKPLAVTYAGCLEMVSVCKACNVKLMEAFMYRFTTRIAKLRELLVSGAVGEVRHVSSTFRFVMNNPASIKLDPALGGGSLWDVGCYPVNIIGMILQDDPVSVCAQKTVRQGIDYSLSAVLKYQNGALCTISSGFDSQSSSLTEINGTEGTILMRDSFDQTDTPILLIKGGIATEIPVAACKRYVLEIEDFADALLTGREPFLSLDESVRNIRLMERVLEAAQ